MNLIDYPDREMLAIDLANRLAGDLENHLLTHETATLAVPGGTTPGPVFDALCAASLDWHRVRVLPTDERWVPQDHPRSNAGLISSRLMCNRAAAATLLPLYAPANDPAEVLAELETPLIPLLPLSVLLLGMGADMHTASLFPGADGLDAALAPEAPTLAVLRPYGQPEARVSLTAHVLDGALSKHLVIYGAEKREALERAMKLPPEEAPVQAVLSAITVHWAE